MIPVVSYILLVFHSPEKVIVLYVRIDMAQGRSSASPAQDSEGIKSMEEGEVIRKL